MLQRLVNEARFDLEVETTGPLLIRSGQATAFGPDMTPVRTFRNDQWEVFIPGSSLKGVLRSQAEKILRTLRPGLTCNPFVRVRDRENDLAGFADVSCGDRFRERNKAQGSRRVTSEVAYRDSCPACRLFGSTEFIGRLSVGDAYLAADQASRTEARDGVGIDRLTGGPAHQAKFDLEAVSSGTILEGKLLLRNFEIWQLGLLLLVLQDLADGLIPIGGGRSRGFGAVTARLPRIAIAHLTPAGAAPAPAEIRGLGSFLGDGSYGTDPADRISGTGLALTWESRGVRRVAEIDAPALESLREAGATALVSRLAAWAVPSDRAQAARR